MSTIGNFPTSSSSTYQNSTISNYPLDSKENVRHAVTAAIYSPIYGPYACPSSNISNPAMMSNQIPTTFHGKASSLTVDFLISPPEAIKTSGWPSSHSVTDLLSSNMNNNFRPSSTPVQTTSTISSPNGGQLTQPNLNPTDPSGMAAAVAAAQSQYSFHNYYMQTLMTHAQSSTGHSMPSIVSPHSFS